MDPAVPGPSRSKRQCTDWRKKQPLTEKEIKDLADKLFESSDDDPFVASEDSWSGADDKDDSDRVDADAVNDVSSSDESDADTQGTLVSTWSDTADIKTLLFSGNPGLRITPTGTLPYDFFTLLVTDDLLNHIVEQTNSFAEEIFLNKSTTEKSRITDWKLLTLAELKVFLGIWFHMGNVHLNRLQDYWKKDELFAIPGLQKYMSRNRFMGIMRCLHFSKNPSSVGDPGYGDRLHKIRYMQDYFNKRMEEVYYPEKELSLDESMVLWRGRLVFRQFIKGKKHKYGMKLYLLAEPNGMILRCNAYSGAQGELGGVGHAEKVVMSLLQGFENKGHGLYMDNFYNSVSLSRKLLDKGTYVTGTLRKGRRENPKVVAGAKIKKGEIITKYSHGVGVSKWRDKREVLFLSTEFEENMIDVQLKRGDTVKKPKAIVMYNENMSGIDRQDQMLAYYPSERKTLRWYKKLGIHLLSMMLLNSFFFFKKATQQKTSFYDYRLEVIRTLLSHKPTVSKGISEIATHFPSKLSRTQRKRCRVCSKKQIRRSSQYYCAACEEQPGLCLNCFPEYHKK